jgi:GPH family glycoside/pentoside/hexuronide:cation symporter
LSNAAVQTARGHLSLGTVINFAAGSLPLAAFGIAMQIYVQPYMTKDLGLPLATVGLAFLVVRLLDLFVDPFLALVMDRTRTPIGRYRVWMFAGMPLFGLAVFELFFAKPGIDLTYLVVWLLVQALGTSLIGLARAAWSANLVTRYEQRSRFYGYMATLGAVGTFVALFIPVLAPLFAGWLHMPPPNNVHAMGWTILALIPIGGLLTGILVHEPVNVDVKTERFPLRDYWDLAKKPEVLRLSFSAFALTMGPAWMGNLYIFFFTDARGFSEQTASLLLIVYVAAGVVAAPFVGLIGARFTKHRTMIASTILYSLGLCTILVTPKADFLAGLPVMIWCGANAIGFDLMTSAMMADVGDEVRLAQGKERMALLFALTGLAAKLASAFSVWASYKLLSITGYQPQAGAHNTPAAIGNLQAIFIIGPIFWVMVGGLCFLGWKLDSKKHAAIRTELDARDALLAHEAELASQGALPGHLVSDGIA